MTTDEEQAAIDRLTASVVRQGELAQLLNVELGPRDPHNLAVLVQIQEAHADARSARRDLVRLGVLEPGDED